MPYSSIVREQLIHSVVYVNTDVHAAASEDFSSQLPSLIPYTHAACTQTVGVSAYTAKVVVQAAPNHV